MFLTRFIGRTLFAAAKSETPAAAAAATATTRTPLNPLEEFFEADRSQDEAKPVVYGRSWKASELRLKSWDDLNKLWYVLLKEKNMLMTQRQMLHAQNLRFPNPERLPKEFVHVNLRMFMELNPDLCSIAIRCMSYKVEEVMIWAWERLCCAPMLCMEFSSFEC
ncbi:structural constituent of ribosome, putative [Ricinus communis]|uniref:Large ribosomal subunit protein uL29m n=1 Tax=Ricinus communis TaxID=3988 RepID=B9RB67_RICCO|nr:structural constituent of ribosome, putative [Ricinus communis]